VSGFESAQLAFTHPLEHCETQPELRSQERFLYSSESLGAIINIKIKAIANKTTITTIIPITVFFMIY